MNVNLCTVRVASTSKRDLEVLFRIAKQDPSFHYGVHGIGEAQRLFV